MIFLVIIGTFFICLLSFLIYYSKIHDFIKAVCFSIFLIFGYYGYINYIEYRSSPIIGYPKDNFLLIHSIVTEKETILLWVYYHEEKKYQVYEIPYQREVAKTIEDAKQEKQNGKEKIGKLIFDEKSKHAPGLIFDDWHGSHPNFTK